MAKPKWRQILLSLTLFSNVTSKEGKPMSCACSVFRPGSHGCKNFASALQRPLPLQLKILQHGHTHFFIEVPHARCSKFGKLFMACILLFCLSLFSFVSSFFFSLLLSLTHAHGSFSLSLSAPPSLSLPLSLSISLSLSRF